MLLLKGQIEYRAVALEAMSDEVPGSPVLW